jgi:hypothetical protein
MKRTTLQMHRLMDLASRPGGVLCRDVAASLGAPRKSGDITKNAKRLQIAGWMTHFEMRREGKTMLARCATTPELFAEWSSEHQVNTTPRKKHVSGPAMTVIRANYGHAWWDKAAKFGEPGYVEPVITSDTKVTICPSFAEHPRWSNTHLQFA